MVEKPYNFTLQIHGCAGELQSFGENIELFHSENSRYFIRVVVYFVAFHQLFQLFFAKFADELGYDFAANVF